MSHVPQHEFDDELLSAYLDDELSAEQRALVEARLASDPAARQTLEQLRNVSQSMRGLPPVSIGRDLHDSVLKRIEGAKPAAAEASDSSGMPQITIGRTSRGWIWASLAIAAALMIMAFQADDARDADVADVARRSRDSVHSGEQPPSGAAEFEAWHGPVVQDDSPNANSLAASRSAGPQIAEGRAESALAPAAESSGVGGQAAADRFAVAPYGDLPSRTAEAISAPPATPHEPAEGLANEDFVVVHVLAKRSAIENKSFDRVLASCGIRVEPADDTAGLAKATRKLEEVDATKRGAARVNEDPAVGEPDVDMVLVEAPMTAIFSCMAELSQDSSNYLGLSVEDSSTSTGEALTPEASPSKKLAMDLEQFTRGATTRQQKEESARDKGAYYQHQPAPAVLGGGQRADRGAAVADGSKHEGGPLLARESALEQGRARRVQPLSTADRTAAAAANSVGQVLQQQNPRFRVKAPTESDPERMQVLFVLSPDGTAASPAAQNPPK